MECAAVLDVLRSSPFASSAEPSHPLFLVDRDDLHTTY